MKSTCLIFFSFIIICLLPVIPVGNLQAQTAGPEWKVYNTSNSGLPGNLLLSLYIDSQNMLWTGTNQDGVGVFDLAAWINYNTGNSGLQANRITCITEDKEGVMWIGTDGGGLASFDHVGWNYYTPANSGLPHSWVTDIVVDESNLKYIGTDGGLVTFDGTGWADIGAGLSYTSIAGLALEGDSVLWACTGWGLGRRNAKGWVNYHSIGGMPSDNFWKVTVDQATGIKWITTQYGLLKYDDAGFTMYSMQNSSLPHDYVMSVVIDPSGKKWIATWGGIAVFDDVNWIIYNTSNSQLPTNTIRQIRIDVYGNKWIATDAGLAEFNETGILATDDVTGALSGMECDIYPNPVKDGLSVSLVLHDKAPVTLEILSACGSRIATIENTILGPGEYRYLLDFDNYSGGIYFLRIKAGDKMLTEKIVRM